MAFTNPFLSLAGQKERLANVVNVLGAAINPFDNKKVVANVTNPTAKAALEAAANSPYTTAAIVATPFSGAARSVVASAASKLGLGTKVALGAATAVAVPAVVSSERLRTSAITTAGNLTPEKLASFGAQSGKLVDNPTLEGAKKLILDNKAIVGAAGAAAVIATGGKFVGAAATLQNTLAVKENTARSALPSTSTTPQPAEAPAASSLTTTAAGASAKPADVVPTSSPPAAAMPDKPMPKTRSAKRRKKRKIYKCAPAKSVSGRFNLSLR